MLKNISKEVTSLDNICYLASHSAPHQDEIGQFIPSEIIKTLCFCAEGSIYSSEFFKYGQEGIKPEVKLVVDSESYSGEMEVIYNEKLYSIYRYFPRSDGLTELYLAHKLGDINE